MGRAHGSAHGLRAADRTGGDPLLAVNNLEVIYEEVILVLRGLSMEVPRGKVIALLGSNGAGKSTTLKAISGLLASENGEITEGSIVIDGRDITHADAASAPCVIEVTAR